jgi:RNA polymerase sigma-70 factor (ECF subfamily)
VTQIGGGFKPVDEHEWLAARFEEHRARLRSVAFRMLGSAAEAEDVVQEAWLRLSRSDHDQVANLGGWLTTVVARVCLDQLRARREQPIDEPPAGALDQSDPEQEALLSDSVGLALLVVLDTLTPAERLAFVLHDMFAVPFEEIAPIVGRSPAAARQLASRARRRVRGASTGSANLLRQRSIVAAFMAASRDGDFAELLRLLDPDAVLRADPTAVAMGAVAEIRGAATVAETFASRARAAQPVLIDGIPGLAWIPDDGQPRVVFGFTFTGGRITAIDIVADRVELDGMDVQPQT